MNTRELDQGITDKWESGDYGRSEDHVAVVSESEDRDIDQSLGLKLISIRLPVSLIETLKLIAKCHGVAYQPMVRDLLTRFARSEMRELAYQLEKQMKQAQVEDESSKAVDAFIERERERKVANG